MDDLAERPPVRLADRRQRTIGRIADAEHEGNQVIIRHPENRACLPGLPPTSDRCRSRGRWRRASSPWSPGRRHSCRSPVCVRPGDRHDQHDRRRSRRDVSRSPPDRGQLRSCPGSVTITKSHGWRFSLTAPAIRPRLSGSGRPATPDRVCTAGHCAARRSRPRFPSCSLSPVVARCRWSSFVTTTVFAGRR